MALVSFSAISATVSAQSRLEKVMGDKSKFESEGLWYYNDLDKAFKVAEKNGQPVLVVLRCVPCHECVKLDDELVESNPVVQQLLKSFVRVRIVTTNGLDLSLFQFDTDQSFSVFVFNADKTLYGRYGTRSDQTKWEDDVSIDGLARALEASLQIHRDYPKNREGLVGKQARQPLFASPEKIPAFAAKYKEKLDYDGNVVQSCIHCHMIGEGIRQHYLSSTGKVPDESLFPYPHPKILGLILDPAQCATVKQVVPGSIAEQSGFKTGDRLEAMNGQLLTSMADAQWVLHGIPMSGGEVMTKYKRGDTAMESIIKLPEGWRRMDSIEWRASSWQLRRDGLGGLLIKSATDEERKFANVKETEMAFRVEHVGAYPPHDRAKKAGVQKGDILITANGLKNFKSPSALLEYSINVVPAGEDITMELMRDGQLVTVKVPTATR
jgi:hypothetical protein